jgi:energy-coupling factor transporter ATP-binding protein EcfA2
MEQFKIQNLNFTYPLTKKDALENINLNIEKGEYIALCGKSGCGKTTLLRSLKSAVAPKGKTSGEIFFNDKKLDDADLREQSQKIGFVMQNPDTQIVTDKVWHELAFGLENLGLDDNTISLRVAEMASYFGIGDWFDKKVTELSGGQKQLLNLAAIMAMHPEVLILDEPTSQLDPIAAENFLETVSKINKELGVTVIISEHRLEQVFTCADRVIVIDNGKIVADASVSDIGKSLEVQPEFIKLSVPTAMRVYYECGGSGTCPITVRDGRRWLEQVNIKSRDCKVKRTELSAESAVSLKNICFAYGKNDKDILRNLSLEIPKQTIFAIMGSNGAGKSTLVKVIAGIAKPYRGKIVIGGQKIEKYKGNELYKNNVAVLPQNVQTLFTAKTVRLDLERMNSQRMNEICALTQIEDFLDSHPFDISGGEQQRAALAKVLMTEPKILILDEPTKGMDSEYKIQFADILKSLKADGCTVILISHDIEFCARYADRCAMLFDGCIASTSDAHEFFNENHFYTTAANRMTRGIISSAVTQEDVISCVKGN